MPSYPRATFLIFTALMSIVGHLQPRVGKLPPELLGHNIAGKLRQDHASIASASSDFGKMSQAAPAAVLYPTTESDIAALLRLSHSSSRPFVVAARGCGHSTQGQAYAREGVVVEMAALGGGGGRVAVSVEGGFVDAGGEQMWINVLRETLRYGLAPPSWTDYLYLTVGGTLSNAGVGGQAFLHGPQISNVYEVDVITGKGDMLTCSESRNPDLFFAVLGGLGQFGIITRARIAVEEAPQKVRWTRLMYTSFETFARDQETLISSRPAGRGWRLGYIEGSMLVDHGLRSNWRSSSFFSKADLRRIAELAAGNGGAVYCLEASFYHSYGGADPNFDDPSVSQELEELLDKLSFLPGLAFTKDMAYPSFLNRVHDGELKLRVLGLWDVPHPWLNLFVPKSRILDFDAGVFRGILKKGEPMGPILVYPTNRTKWDDRMMAMTPEEEVFYSVGLLLSAEKDDLVFLEKQNAEILQFCEQTGIKFKQYLPGYRRREEWKKHFGGKWKRFVEMKMKYDPKAILSPGQGIFT